MYLQVMTILIKIAIEIDTTNTSKVQLQKSGNTYYLKGYNTKKEMWSVTQKIQHDDIESSSSTYVDKQSNEFSNIVISNDTTYRKIQGKVF